MDVDKLFKLPKLPQSSLNKRKWKEPDAAALKAARVEEEPEESKDGVSVANGQAAVHDVGEGHAEADEFAPGNDADYFVEEDEEGRFYGGGLTQQQKRILELMEGVGKEDDYAASSSEQELRAVRKLLLHLERAITKNQEMRIKYPDKPEKFIDSEVELHAAIKSLGIVTTNPSLLYPELVKQSATASLCGLLSHENVDIAASVIVLLEEMTDDDVLDAGVDGRTVEEQEANGIGRRALEAVEEVLTSLLENSLLELLVQMLSRLSSDKQQTEEHTAIDVANAESDSATIFHLLGVIENVVSIKPSLANSILQKDFQTWITNTISADVKSDQNKAYAAELLCALLQAGAPEDSEKRASLFVSDGGMDRILEAIAPLRKQDPRDDDQCEFYDNLFDALCATLNNAASKLAFEKAEGVELMCLLLKDKSFARSRALKVLNYATSGVQGSSNAIVLVQRNGLKGMFSAWSHENATAADESNAVEIAASLLNNLASGSEERRKLIARFERHDYERIDRLIEMHTLLHVRVDGVEKVFRQEHGDIGDDDQDAMQELVEEKLDAGLYVLQLVDYVIAWLIMESDDVLTHINQIIQRRGESMLLHQVIDILKAYYDNVGDEVIVAPSEEEGEDPLLLQDVLVQLVNYLLGVV
jgi:beta-catenin-like protein 1